MTSIPVFWKPNPRARRLALRIDPTRRGVVITLPTGTTRKQGLDFLQSRMEWALTALADLPQPVQHGSFLMVEGEDKQILSCPDARRGVWLEKDMLCVSGDPAHLERRLRDWLMEKARLTLPRILHAHAEQHGFTPSRIDLRDVRSRWGSCTRQGRVMLSWRLILAPPAIRDYVMLHELAHLRHFNHGAEFWQLVDQLLPEGKTSREAAESWLKTHGVKLLAAI